MTNFWIAGMKLNSFNYWCSKLGDMEILWLSAY